MGELQFRRRAPGHGSGACCICSRHCPPAPEIIRAAVSRYRSAHREKLMKRILLITSALTVFAAFAVHTSQVTAAAQHDNQPTYTKDGKLVMPPNYREWFF